jgi:hypothetical protein
VQLLPQGHHSFEAAGFLAATLGEWMALVGEEPAKTAMSKECGSLPVEAADPVVLEPVLVLELELALELALALVLELEPELALALEQELTLESSHGMLPQQRSCFGWPAPCDAPVQPARPCLQQVGFGSVWQPAWLCWTPHTPGVQATRGSG